MIFQGGQHTSLGGIKYNFTLSKIMLELNWKLV